MKTKKADIAEHLRVFPHVGLLVNKPSSYAGVPFVKSSNNHQPISILMVHLENDKTRGFLFSLHFVIRSRNCWAWADAHVTLGHAGDFAAGYFFAWRYKGD